VPATDATVTCSELNVLETTAVRHVTLVPEDHLAVPHWFPNKRTLFVYTISPKLRPATVSDARPLRMILGDVHDSRGASKEKTVVEVPTIAPTVTSASRANMFTTAPVSHATDVELVHAEVEQMTVPILAVELNETVPKLKPVTVIEASPVRGAFSKAAEATVVSNVNREAAEPTKPPTVTVRRLVVVTPCSVKHTSAVLVTHERVPQVTNCNSEVTVRSTTANSRPVMLKERALSDWTKFISPPVYDATGASNVSSSDPVPIMEPSVTCVDTYFK